MIVKVGLSHRTAPVEVRELLAFRREDLPGVLDDLRTHAPVGEVAVLSTCNRVEVYAALPRGIEPTPERLDAAGRAIAERLAEKGGPRLGQCLARAQGPDAIRHLFRVASSLDSLVLGEPQILGQLKDAIGAATQQGTLGTWLGKAMRRAVHVGKRVRHETAIGAGQVSVASVAADLSAQIFGELSGRTVLLVGAGEMAEGAAKQLAKSGAKLVVVNRSRERADRLAAEFAGSARDWAELNWCLIEADIVVASTASANFVITKEAITTARKARRGRSLFLVDIAVPRNIDPRVGELDDVYLYDIDDLQQIVQESLAGRAAEAARAEAIVEAELAQFEAWRTELAMSPVIVGLRERTRGALVAELERSLSGKLKHLGPAERDALLVMVEAATNRLCHRPTVRLKSLAGDARGADYAEVLADLYDLSASGDGSPRRASDPGGTDSLPPSIETAKEKPE